MRTCLPRSGLAASNQRAWEVASRSAPSTGLGPREHWAERRPRDSGGSQRDRRPSRWLPLAFRGDSRRSPGVNLRSVRVLSVPTATEAHARPNSGVPVSPPGLLSPSAPRPFRSYLYFFLHHVPHMSKRKAVSQIKCDIFRTVET